MKENSPRSEGAKTTESVDSLKVRIRELEKEVERWKSQVKTVRYGLNWIDVPEAFDRDAEEKIPVLEEVSEKAIEAAGPLAGRPPHVIIEGDNYHALTCLNYTHRGKIDVIYIDPPYNTGSDGFTYKDKRFLTEYPDGKKVPREDPLRHSYWLSFMEKRLKLAKNLLSDKGVIFISIDDNEQANLKLLCDRIFGRGIILQQSIGERIVNRIMQEIRCLFPMNLYWFISRINQLNLFKIMQRWMRMKKGNTQYILFYKPIKRYGHILLQKGFSAKENSKEVGQRAQKMISAMLMF